MARRFWAFAAAAVAAAAVPVAPQDAAAASCCGGASASSLLALGTWDRALIGAAAGSTLDLAYRDDDGDRRGDPGRYRGSDTRLSIAGAVRVAPRLQLGAVLPVVARRVVAAGSAATAGGVGDVQAAGRWELLRDDHCYAVPLTQLTWADMRPELHVVARVVAPTGRSAAQSGDPLGADVLGQGMWRAEFGLEASKAWGRGGIGLALNTGPVWAAARAGNDARGAQLSAGATVLWYPAYKRYLGAGITQRQTWWAGDGVQRETTPGLVAATRLGPWWLRLQVAAPAAIAGRNVPVGLAATGALLYVFGGA